MKNLGKVLLYICYACVIFAVANCITIAKLLGSAVYLWIGIPLFVMINIIPSFFYFDLKTGRLRNSAYGCELLRLFLFSNGCFCHLLGCWVDGKAAPWDTCGRTGYVVSEFAADLSGRVCRILERNHSDLYHLAAAWNPLACDRCGVRNDTDCTSGGAGDADTYSRKGGAHRESEAAFERGTVQGTDL